MSGKKLWKPEFDDMVYKKLKEIGHYYPREVVYWINKAFVECIVDAIENGDSIQVHRTFSLQPKLVAAHKIGNFGKPLIIPEHYVATFRARSRIKKACEKLMENEKKSDKEKECN